MSKHQSTKNRDFVKARPSRTIRITAGLTLVITLVTIVVLLNPFIKKTSQTSFAQTSMTDAAPTPLPEPTVTHLVAKTFRFTAEVAPPSASSTHAARYTETISQSANGALDITLLQSEQSLKSIIRVGTVPAPCPASATRACAQGAAPARGNVAEIQITLPGDRLRPGTYAFGAEGATTTATGLLYWRQLYSDPSHGQLGCQRWGVGSLTVERADYSAEGQLETLEAQLTWACQQTAPFPAMLPQDSAVQQNREPIENYTIRVAWQGQELIPQSLNSH